VTFDLDSTQFDPLRAALEGMGFTFEDRPHQVFLARGAGVVVSLFHSGKVVLGGPVEKQDHVIAKLLALGARPLVKSHKDLPPLHVQGTRVGMDEVGKGDYFGPLVVCSVLVTEGQGDRLKDLGVRDSKTLGDTTIANLAVKVRRLLPTEQIKIVPLAPVRYNLLYEKMTNVNRVLGWAHATALEDVLVSREPCKLAVADQFGDQSYIEGALKKRGKEIELIQVPHAERDVAVATASVIARDGLLRARLEMREEYGEDFPLGATDVEKFATRLVQRLGAGALLATAKVHFATTARVLGADVDMRPQLRTLAAQAVVYSDLGPLRVETSRLEGYSLLDTFEPELRAFIQEELQRRYGVNWWTDGVPKEIREKAERRRRQEAEKGRHAELMDCLDFAHYEMILHQDNWEPIFRAIFQDDNSLLARLRPIQDIRNPVAHTRGLTRGDKATLIGAIEWVRAKIAEYRHGLVQPIGLPERPARSTPS
jgi:ribonuclease HIII